MSFVLFRIDERLLHGQVLVGWGGRLELRYYVVVDEALAASTWEQELYGAGLPEDVRAFFLGRDAAAARFDRLDDSPEPGALLTRDTRAMRDLAERGLLEGREVNLGGMHAAPGRRRALDYVYLGPGEMADLTAIERLGSSVSARDLPTSRPVSLPRLLNAAAEG